MEWDSSKQQQCQMIPSLPICVCCFPVVGTPVLPWPHPQCKPNSKCGQCTVSWSWSSPVRLGERGRDVFVDLWCAPAQETLWSIPELLIHSLRATSSTALHRPTGNSSASAGSHWWDTMHSYSSSSSSCAGKNKFSGFPAVKCKCYLVKIFFIFYFHPTENNSPGSWKQPLCFLLAISSLFSHVHFSNQCGDACQERLLLNFFLTASWNIFLKENHTGT